MKPIDITSSKYIEFNVESNYKDSKYKIGDHVNIKI